MEEKDITLSVAEKMLSYVDSTDREIWYKMAAALKNHFGEDGRGLYHKWSAKAKNYNERAADSQFNSARYGSNNIWFLYNRAKERGWQPDKTYQPTAAEIEQQRQKLAQAEKKRQKEERERAKKQANASRRAKYVFEERTKQADTQHPYLVKKGISDPAVLQHIRQSGNNLIIPLKQGKKVVGMEMIFPNGGKHFPANTPKKGSALFLGDTRLENIKQGFFVAEGFATAASIVQATGRPCLMTIDAGNMPTVAKTLKPLIDKYQMPVWVAADINDGSVKNPNVGLQHAQEVVEILGETVRIITPDFTDNEVQQWKITHDNEPPTDFNDLQAIGGIERVRSVLATAFSEPEPVVNIQNPEQKLLINVYGSPATGKSYTAEHLAALLKDAGIECELVTEYATELIHQGRTDELKDQVVVTGEQLRREQAALNHANIVITDSPTALGIIYAPEHQKAALHDIAAQSDKIPHINILLRHDYESLATFSINGRIHGKEQSLAIQEQLIELLKGKERIHHQRATPFEELINHIGTNQEWQRFAEHHNINLPRFDIAMDGTVMNKDDNLSGSLNVAENDTLVVEKTAESITMNDLKPIQARSYDNDPIRKAIQDIVIDDIKANFTLYQQEYRQHPESFDGRYICSDLFKETIPFYNTDRETRSLFNGLVHNSAAVLADKQFYDALSEIRQENDSKGKVAVFLTGSPGAGKTSSVQQGMVDEPNTALIYEGQLIRPESAIDKIQAALDSGLKVKILAVQNTPETALDNTIRRFEKLGRGSSIEVMAQIMGKTADGLDQLHQHFGDRIELEIHERHENDPLPPQYGWEHLDILRKYGDYEKTKQYLGQVLEQSRETGTYSENALHQANGRVGRVEQKHKLSLTSALLAYETRPRVLGDSRKQSLLSALETLTPSKQNSEISTNPEKPRPPQGGFVLPAINQSDENRQPENSNSKENSMDEQQQGLQASSFTPDKFQPDTWQPESGLEQNKHLDGETAQKVDETTTQAVDNTEKDLSGSPEQSAKPQIDKDFAERQAELNRQKAEWQNKLDEMYRQKEAMDNLQVQLTQEQLDEIDKKFEEIYAKQAELDRQTDELQIERRQVLGQADISENLNEENSIYFGESDEIITAEEINKPQAVFATPKEKANAVFEELKTHYQGYGEYNSKDGVMYLPNGKNAEMLHFDPTQERIVLSAVNPQTKGREEVADTHFSNLDPHYIALAVDKDYKEYQQIIAQNQGKFPDNEQKQTIDKAGDSVEETIRTAKSKTAKLTPPNAPPETISERYNAVERKFLDTKTNLRLTHRVDYVDSENGKTVLFTDKGSKLTTAKNDPQTAADMVEVAKAKGWTTLKLSGNKEFKRQAWLAAESQGIKTKGYKPSPQDLAMLEKMREKRSLNSVEQTKKQEKAPDRLPENTPQAEKQADKTPQKDLSGSPKQTTKQDTADKLKGGILLAHGKAPYQFKENGNESYFATIQKPNGEEKTYWGVDIERAIQESGIDDGDRISLKKVGQETVRVQEEVKDEHGKTVLDDDGNPLTEEVMRERMKWQAELYEKAQEVPKEQGQPEKTTAKQDDLPQERLIKHDLMGQPEKNPAELSQKVDEAIFGKRPDEDASVARKSVYTALKVKDAITIGAGVAAGGVVGGAAAVGLVAAQNYAIDKGVQTVEKTVGKDGKTFDIESQKQQITADMKQMFNNPEQPIGVSNAQPSFQQVKDEYEKVKTTHLDDTQRQHLGVAERYLHKSLQDCNASPQYKEFCLCNFYRSITAEIKNGTIDIPNPYQSNSVGKSRGMGKSQTQTQTKSKSQSKSKGVDI